MNKVLQLWRIATHPRELRMALSGLGVRLAGDDALGGLTDSETEALVRWTKEPGVDAFVEIGTLFGLTARTVAQLAGKRVVAVDNFCWNPFGLTPAQHEAFTRKILSGSGVEVLILHTHGTEAYTPSDGLTYEASEEDRTLDPDRSVIRVGEELRLVLEARGIGVVEILEVNGIE